MEGKVTMFNRLLRSFGMPCGVEGRSMHLMSGVAAALMAATVAQAGPMLQPSGASTNMGSFNTFEPIYAINQSGLAAPYVSGVTDFDTFVPSTATVGGGSSFNTWYSAAGNLTGNFDFALGGTYTIGSLAIWADPQGIGQGVNQFNLYADDNAAFSSPTLLGTYAAADGTGNATNVGQVFGFAPTSASYVRMEILSNHGSTLTTGMVEAAFETVVPEPGVAGVMGMGVAMVGVGRRRR